MVDITVRVKNDKAWLTVAGQTVDLAFNYDPSRWELAILAKKLLGRRTELIQKQTRKAAEKYRNV